MSISTNKIKIAIDAFGGDYAPENEVRGGLEILRSSNNRFHLVFVGKEKLILAEIKKQNSKGLDFSVINADEVIGMHESPVTALRQKQNSSIVVGMNLLKENKVDAFTSAGNTGAMTAAATMILGRIKGVSRPTICAFFPTKKGTTLVLDVGAVPDTKPHYLYEFGLMGSIYYEFVLGKKHPTVGLLNIGEETSKGDEKTKETFKLYSSGEKIVRFIGNIEGGDVLEGKADIVVCDGFLGNIVMKFGESIPSFLKFKFTEFSKLSFKNKLMMALLRSSIKSVFKDLDYEEYGGVPLLGVNGAIIIGHGRSTPKAIKNMILRTEEMVMQNVNEHIRSILHEAEEYEHSAGII
ncbi:MAG: phosphate acyltransferase PlsX [Bacteroidetes bacterium]|nr:phosphate acyltransferase PlsX [Bacteroidota bacterium]